MKTSAELIEYMKENPSLNHDDIYVLGGDDKRYDIRTSITENVIARLYKGPKVTTKLQNFFYVITHLRTVLIVFWVGIDAIWALGIDREAIGIKLKDKRKEYKKELPLKKLKVKQKNVELKIERLNAEKEKLEREITSRPLP